MFYVLMILIILTISIEVLPAFQCTMVLAEFDYDNKPTPSFSFDTSMLLAFLTIAMYSKNLFQIREFCTLKSAL